MHNIEISGDTNKKGVCEIIFLDNLFVNIVTNGKEQFAQIICSLFLMTLIVKLTGKIKTEEGDFYSINRKEIVQIFSLLISTWLLVLSQGQLWSEALNSILFAVLPLLVIQFFIDVKYMELTDEWTAALSVSAVAAFLLYDTSSLPSRSVSVVILFSIFFIFWFFTGGVGYGDVKLMIAIGWMIPVTLIFGFVYLSFVLATVIGIPLNIKEIRKRKREGKPLEFPFGPYLIMGLLLLPII